MSKYISMLRGINVGGEKKLRMETLREIYQSAGFWNIRTYLQSGNVMFETAESDLSGLTTVIETLVEETCGYPVKVFIRIPSEFTQILLNNPFVNTEKNKLHVTFLYQIPPATAWEKLIIPSGIPDKFEQGNQDIYLYCPNGYGSTKISNSFFERKLGVATTTRNWNTVQALYRLSEEGDSESRGGK